MSRQQLPLTGLEIGSVAPWVLVCGNPARATQIAQLLDSPCLLQERREYRAYQGKFDGLPVTVCSHGVGASGAAIAFEELIAAGGLNLIRVGTCGALQPEIEAGHLVIATAAVQHTGYGRETVPEGYPPVADLDLTLALRETAVSFPYPWHAGIVLTRDNFYAGVETRFAPHYRTLSAANVLAVEMECAALFIVGNLRQVRTAAILTVDGNVLHKNENMNTYNPYHPQTQQTVTGTIQIALQTLKRFSELEPNLPENHVPG